MREGQREGLKTLANRYPWPDGPPDMPEDWHGWLCADTAAALVEACQPDPEVIIELGTWLGFSARAILENTRRATLICIDHWRGSPEHQIEAGKEEWYNRLPTLYETFLRNLWPCRDRVIPLRADTLIGLAEVGDLEIEPGLVYVDSEHSVDRVTRELAFITAAWPTAGIVGDDYDNAAVKLAADQHAIALGRPLVVKGAAFCFPAWSRP
jgi:hypothetical protein